MISLEKITLFFIFILIFFPRYGNADAKKIMFIVHTETINGKGVLEIYNALKKQGHDVKIVGIPLLTAENKILYDLDPAFCEKFDSKDIVYPCGKQKPYTKCEDMGDYHPDVVFVQNPYNSHTGALDPMFSASSFPEDSRINRLFTLESLKKIAGKVAYIVYGPYLFHQATCDNVYLKKVIDLIFVDSESTKEIFVERYKFSPENVLVSGFQSYKNVRDKMRSSQRPKNSYKETILWLPRWTTHFRDRDLFEGGSTFLNYVWFFYNYAKNNPETKFIIRPHVALFPWGIENNVFSQEDVDFIKRRFNSLKNVTFSEHINSPLEDDVIASDIVISDGTSALGEVIVADKPIIYLSNGWNNEFNSNKLAKELKKCIYFAHDPNEIIEWLNFIRKNDYTAFTEEKKGRLASLKRFFWGKSSSPCRDEFKKRLDPVENPAKYIADYVSNAP